MLSALLAEYQYSDLSGEIYDALGQLAAPFNKNLQMGGGNVSGRPRPNMAARRTRFYFDRRIRASLRRKGSPRPTFAGLPHFNQIRSIFVWQSNLSKAKLAEILLDQIFLLYFTV